MKKISSILLAFMFLVSSVGFTISRHHCGGMIHKQSIHLIAEDLSCGMETAEEVPCEDNIISSNCCQNKFQNFKIADNFQKTGEEINSDFNFVIAFINSYVTLFTIPTSNVTQYLAYKPPLPDKDIPIFIQSFLI